ncbi:hypothetical protein EYS14_05455 [Alteromonadaceae bacterium M269]|nr:hypothetical protein EYS14_05455 [Alteromonadaceae bacterium M269]
MNEPHWADNFQKLKPLPQEDIERKEQVLGQFLELWPLSRLHEMRLEDYSSAGSRDSFTYMVERGTSILGGIRGGSSFKFGIFARASQEEKNSHGPYCYSQRHAWYKRYGDDVDTAFAKVKSLVLEVVEAAQKGNVEAISDIELDDLFKWKLAFLYQNMSNPIVLSVYTHDCLVELVNGDGNEPFDALYSQLLAHMPKSLDIHSYSASLWHYWKSGEIEVDPKTDELEEEEEGQETVNEEEKEISIVGITYLHDMTPQYVDDIPDTDRLGREPFARYMSHHIQQLWDRVNGVKPTPSSTTKAPNPHGKSFLINLYGKWGAGKTTFAVMLMNVLKQGSNSRPAWLPVHFNAWKQQDVEPTWWPLMDTIIRQSIASSDHSWWLRLRYFAWRFLGSNLPKLIGTAVVVIITGLVFYLISTKAPDSLKLWLQILTAAVGAAATVSNIFNSVFLRSPKSAQLFKKLRNNPTDSIRDYFATFIKKLNKPVIVFVDDLDRCRPEYAVALLEQIHIVFNTSRVFFLVAADRHWIASSFSLAYENMGKDLKETGRSIGYLYIEKVFQLSIGLPRISPVAQQRYLKYLLEHEEQEPLGAIDKGEKEQTAAIKGRFADAENDSDIFSIEQKLIQEGYSKALIADQMMEKAGNKGITSKREHRMNKFVGELLPNPRLMKLIVSAYGIYIYLYKDLNHGEQDYDYLDQIAIWTIISVSFPRLADHLEQNPEHLDIVKNEQLTDEEKGKLPEDILEIKQAAIVSKALKYKLLDGTEVELSKNFLEDLVLEE